VAYPVVDPSAADYFTLNMLNMVMGSVQTSRIIANVREKHGYSYNISTRLSARPGTSKWMVSGDVVNASVGAAVREVLAEIGRVRDMPLPAAELRGFQTFMAGIVLSENSTPDGLVSTIGWLTLYGVDRNYVRNFVDRVYALTPSDIQAVARRHLVPERAAIVIIGDRKVVEPQLEGLVAVQPAEIVITSTGTIRWK
jgi:zinc protease